MLIFYSGNALHSQSNEVSTDYKNTTYTYKTVEHHPIKADVYRYPDQVIEFLNTYLK